jgi:hypothetical protein
LVEKLGVCGIEAYSIVITAWIIRGRIILEPLS